MNQKEYLKELHKVEVEILDEIDKVCKKNNIKYFIVGGTLLGAVRHKGFIPWDDDIDIGMLRSDYEKFKNICLDNKALSKKYFLHCYETDENYWLPFMKVRKNNTTFDEQFINSLNRHKGIFVDIFPFDDIDKENGFFNKIRAFFTLKTTEAIHCKFKLRNPNTCRRKIVVKFLMLFKKKKLDKFQKKLLTFKNGKDLDYVCCFVGGANPFAELVKKDKSFPLISISFEGKKYPCFNNYELYLERLYGDYMTLPPKDKRVTHMPSSVSFTSGKSVETKRIV